MSSPELEKFELTDEDLNPTMKRFKMSKNQAIYGVWADDEDEEDTRPRYSGRKSAKDYLAPVSFVSGGIKIGDKVTKQEGEDEIVDSDDDDEIEVRRSAVRRAFGGSKKKPAKDAPMSMNSTILKMMSTMGHVPGKGLGKNLQGISNPVEAVQRKGRGAIGMYGPEKSERAEKDFPTKPDSEEEEEKEFKQKLQRWKKDQPGQKVEQRKQKTKYVTVEELIATSIGQKRSRENESELAKVKVIDMTGKEQRVLSGYHALSMKHDKPSEDDVIIKSREKLFDLPELLHNLDLLVDMSADAILKNDKQLKYEQDMVVNLKHDHEQLEKVCEDEEKQISRMTAIIKIIDECANCSKVTGLKSLEFCARMFAKLQSDFYVEYALYDLSSVAVSIVFPLMKTEFEGWDPLKEPHRGIETMHKWKDILQGDSEPAYNQGHMTGWAMSPYESLIWEIFMPCVRTAIMKNWNVRYPERLLDCLESWRPLVPEWMMVNILEKLVFPKVQMEVEIWNPLTDTMPIHSWIHPWLPMMCERLEPVYAPIRQKLANALTKWHPSDASAKLILQPWVGVFNPHHLSVFLTKNIVPKLALCMQEFIINPHHQQLDAWKWVMSWQDMVSPVEMVKILTENFFPRWLRVLATWLSSNPNYEEVMKWYVGWKTQLPDVLLCHPSVKEYWNEALEMMNRAISDYCQPGARENIAYLTLTERRRDFEPDRKDIPENIPISLGLPAIANTVKERLEQLAEENGILFMPIPNKTHEGRQIYKLGKLNLTIDKTMMHYQENGQWKMTSSLETLIDKAE